MSGARDGVCVACGRFAGRAARICPFCGEAVAADPRRTAARLAALLAAGAALGSAAVLADPAAQAARVRHAAETPAGAVLLAMGLVLCLLPRIGTHGPEGDPVPARRAARAKLAGQSLLGLAAACVGALLPAAAEEPAASACAALAALCVGAIPALFDVNRAPLGALPLAALAVWLRGG